MQTAPGRPTLDELLEFPCVYPFKAFGQVAPESDFAAAVYQAVNSVMPIPLDAMMSRPSSKGNYLCVTIMVRVDSLAQIEAIYTALQRVEGLTYLL